MSTGSEHNESLGRRRFLLEPQNSAQLFEQQICTRRTERSSTRHVRTQISFQRVNQSITRRAKHISERSQLATQLHLVIIHQRLVDFSSQIAVNMKISKNRAQVRFLPTTTIGLPSRSASVIVPEPAWPTMRSASRISLASDGLYRNLRIHKIEIYKYFFIQVRNAMVTSRRHGACVARVGPHRFASTLLNSRVHAKLQSRVVYRRLRSAR